MPSPTPSAPEHAGQVPAARSRRLRRRWTALAALGLLLGGGAGLWQWRAAAHDRAEDALPEAIRAGALEPVAAFTGAMPTGVAVSDRGRIFVSFPRWGDAVPFTVAEVVGGTAVPYPDAEMNRADRQRPSLSFLSVQSVVVDSRGRLWALDTGRPSLEPAIPGGPKLVAIDLATNRVARTIALPRDVALPTTYLNDVRFDLRRGAEGVAYITDSSESGPNGIIVVDLATGASRRRLHDHPSTKAEPAFMPFVEGQLLMRQPRGQAPRPIAIGADGIALGADGRRLFYSPLAARRLYSVSTDALLGDAPDAQVAAAVRDEGRKPASDGLEHDAQGRLYATAYELNAVVRRRPDGLYETIVHDPRVLWPDTLALAADGHLYFIANQLHRQPDYHGGLDLREKPYSLFRVKVDGSPVRLGS
jgi:sugar lactone lactonase YvrE